MPRLNRLLAGAVFATAVWVGGTAVPSAYAAAVDATTSDQSVAAYVDPAHDGNLAHDTLAAPLSLSWSVAMQYPVYPLVDGGKVFVTYQVQSTSVQPTVVALAESTGRPIWGPSLVGGNNAATLALESGKLFVLSDSGQLTAVDENTGSLLWRTLLSGESSFVAPTALNGVIYITGNGSNGAGLYAVRESDGSSLWTVSLPASVGVATVSPGGVYVATACGEAFDYNPGSGALIWHHPASCTSGNPSTPVLSGGRLYVATVGNGNVILDANTGTSVGTFASVVPPAFQGSHVVYRDTYGVHAADVSTGSTLWSFSGDGFLSSSPIVVNGMVYVGSSKGNLYAVDSSTGTQAWMGTIPDAVPDGQSGSSLAAGDGMLFVPGGQGLYAFAGQVALYPGDETWTNVPVGQTATPPAAITLVNNSVSAGLTPTISISGDFSQTNNCPSSLPLGSSCTISVTFSPTTTSTRTGSLTVSDNAAGSPHIVALTGMPTPPGPVDHIAISPTSASVTAGSGQTYAVEAYDANGTDLGNVTGSSTFAITPDGSCSAATCTATLAGSHTITATYSGKTAGATLLVVAGAASRISVSPSTATITAGGSQAYAATAYDQYGNTLGDVTGGTTFAFNGGPACSGNVCSTTKAFSWTVVASYGSLGTYVTLNVTPGPAASLVLNPASTSITLGGGQSYNAEAFDQYGNDIGNLASSSSFSIAPDGTCTGISCSPALAGAHTVTATDGAATGTASLTATAGPPYRLVVSPAVTTIAAGGSASFSAEAYDQYNNDLGDVTARTTFNLDSATGPACSANVCSSTVAPGHQVVAAYQGIIGYASLNVTPGPLNHMTVQGASNATTAGSFVQFRSFGYDVYNNPLGEVTSASAFAIAPDGTCSANLCGSTKSGMHTITASDGTVVVTAALTVNPAAPASLAISPATSGISAGQSQAYRAEAFDQYGNDAGDYTASSSFVIGPDGSCSGATCSATKVGTHNVTATWGIASGAASLSVGPGPLTTLAVSPIKIDTIVGDRTGLTGSGEDAYGNTVNIVNSATWSLSSGTPGSLATTSGLTTSFQASASTSGNGSVIFTSGSLTVKVPVTVRPAAPTQLAGTTNGKKVSLTWTKGAADAAFQIYRQTGNGTFSLIALTLSTSYTDSNLTSSMTYQYYVVAVGAGGVSSSPSNTVSITVK